MFIIDMDMNEFDRINLNFIILSQILNSHIVC